MKKPGHRSCRIAEEFISYCVNPAVRMRQQIRDELSKIDQEYKWVTIKSQIPDEFQLSHPDERPNPEKENKKIDPLRPDRSPEEKTVDIVEGQTGISYENLFLPYLQGADHIKICDPYIRLQYRIYNLMNFCEILEPLENKLTVIQVKHACRKLNYLNVVYRKQSFTHDPEKKSTYI